MPPKESGQQRRKRLQQEAAAQCEAAAQEAAAAAKRAAILEAVEAERAAKRARIEARPSSPSDDEGVELLLGGSDPRSSARLEQLVQQQQKLLERVERSNQQRDEALQQLLRQQQQQQQQQQRESSSLGSGPKEPGVFAFHHEALTYIAESSEKGAEVIERLSHAARANQVISEVWSNMSGGTPYQQQAIMGELLAAAPTSTLAQLRSLAQSKVAAVNRDRLLEDCLYGARYGAGSSGGGGRGGYRAPPAAAGAAAAAGGSSVRGACYKCGDTSHYARDCKQPAGVRGGSGANAAPLGSGPLLLGPPPQ